MVVSCRPGSFRRPVSQTGPPQIGTQHIYIVVDMNIMSLLTQQVWVHALLVADLFMHASLAASAGLDVGRALQNLTHNTYI
jgi:hypothetical protein